MIIPPCVPVLPSLRLPPRSSRSAVSRWSRTSSFSLRPRLLPSAITSSLLLASCLALADSFIELAPLRPGVLRGGCLAGPVSRVGGWTLFKQGTELEAIARGNLEMSIASAQELATLIPAWSIFTAGYLMRDAEHQKKVFANPVIGKEM